MSVTPQETLAHLARLDRARQVAAQERAARLRAGLPRAARLLRDTYGAKRIALFGSLATGGFSDSSDVDLAVDHLDGARYFDALTELMDVFGGPVDLVVLDEAPESLRDRIEAEGEPL